MTKKTAKTSLNEFKSDDLTSEIPDPTGGAAGLPNSNNGSGDVAPVGIDSNLALLNGVLNTIRALSPEQLTAVFGTMMPYLNPEDKSVGKGRPASTQNQATLNPGAGAVPQMPMQTLATEEIEKLFAESGLSEAVVGKIKLIFETAVLERVLVVEATLKDEVRAELDEEIAKLEADMKEVVLEMVEGMDSYLDLAVSEWLKENEIAVESGIKTQIGESVIKGLKTLAEDHAITITESTEDAVEEMKAAVEELTAKYNSLAESSMAIKAENEVFKRAEITESVCAGMTATQIQKVKSLSESADFVSEENFRTRINVIKEQFIAETASTPKKTNYEPVLLSETTEETEVKVLDPKMQRYIDAARRAQSRS